MAVFTYEGEVSESTDGRPILVAATGTPGTLIHTAHATAKDEIYLFAFNNHTAPVLLTLEWGGVTDPDDLLPFNIPHQSGGYFAAPGMVLTGGLLVRAFASVANKITIKGQFLRRT